jgi:hypothetical protein
VVLEALAAFSVVCPLLVALLALFPVCRHMSFDITFYLAFLCSHISKMEVEAIVVAKDLVHIQEIYLIGSTLAKYF